MSKILLQSSLYIGSGSTSSYLTCDSCPLAKLSRLPFPISQSSIENPFELVHFDIWSPYRTLTCNGCKYFLTGLDDYSRGLWTILLPIKQHTSKALQDFHCYVQTQFNRCIKSI